MGFLVPVAQYIGGALTGSFAGASTFGTVASGIATASQFISPIASLFQANSESQAAKFNAQVFARNQRISELQAARQAEKQSIEDRKKLGAMRAAAGGSGVSFEGSIVDAFNEGIVTMASNQNDILFQGAVNASDNAIKASQQRARVSSARTGGFLSAGGSFLKQIPQIGRAIDLQGSGGFV